MHHTLFHSHSILLPFYTYWLVKGRATLQKRNSRVQINQSVAQSLDSKPQKDYHPTHWRANTFTTTKISEILTPQHYLLNGTDIPRSGGNIFILDTAHTNSSLQDSVHPVIVSCPWHLKTVVDVAHHFSQHTITINRVSLIK